MTNLNSEVPIIITTHETTFKLLNKVIAKIEVKDSLTKTIIVNQTFRSSTSYSVQDRISETAKVENKSTEDLIEKIYREILISLSQNIDKI